MKLPQVYADALLIAFISIALWESFNPRRQNTRPTLRRWGRNWILAGTTDLVGLLLRVSPIATAAAVASSPYGLLNGSSTPLALRVVASLFILDFFQYLRHRGMHVFGAFWRLHQVHHSDEEFDVTTGLRFHPGEAAVTQILYVGVVALLAPPVAGVFVADLAAIVLNVFTHANIRLPQPLERRLRMVLITPEMHRVHHSVRGDEQNSNFGVVFPFWDRLFGTYRAAPADADDELRFGLREWQHRAPLTLGTLLRMPFAIAGSRSRVQSVAEGQS